MRGIVVFALMFTLAFPVLPALAAKGKKGNSQSRFEKLDTNHDGQLSKAEFAGKKKNKKGGKKKGKAKKGKGKKQNKQGKKKDGKGKKNKKSS